MYPSAFSTQEEIIKKLRGASRLFSFENNKVISQIVYDVYKLCYYSLERKKTHIEKPPKHLLIKRKEITRLLNLINYHYLNNKVFRTDHELEQCFGPRFTEGDAVRFFEEYIERTVEDKHGVEVKIDLDNGLKFMYKNPDTGRHEVAPEFYLPSRGKRLPWITHTIRNTTNIYERVDKREVRAVEHTERVYVSEYDIPLADEESKRCFWVVITRKYRKDKTGPFHFRTAFRIPRYNGLLKRLEPFSPVYK